MDWDGTVQKVAKFIDVWYYGDGATTPPDPAMEAAVIAFLEKMNLNKEGEECIRIYDDLWRIGDKWSISPFHE